jgi:hypothetical protein
MFSWWEYIDIYSCVVQIMGDSHILCITVRENRIICCQILCDLLLKSAFKRNFNVMRLILVRIKWHIKWKYLIQKLHDNCHSYYLEQIAKYLTAANSVFPYSNAKNMRVTQDLNSFGKIIAHAQCSVDWKGHVLIFLAHILLGKITC